MPNWVINNLKIRCKTEQKAQEIFTAAEHENLLNYLVPQPREFYTYARQNKVAYFKQGDFSDSTRKGLLHFFIISELDSNEKEEAKNDHLFSYLMREKVRTCNYWYEKKLKGHLSFLNLVDRSIVTPISESEYYEILRKDSEIKWSEWRVENWGTKWDIDLVDAKKLGKQLVINFRTPWAPPIKALERLLSDHQLANINLSFDSLENDYVGSWINGEFNLDDGFYSRQIPKIEESEDSIF